MATAPHTANDFEARMKGFEIAGATPFCDFGSFDAAQQILDRAYALAVAIETATEDSDEYRHLNRIIQCQSLRAVADLVALAAYCVEEDWQKRKAFRVAAV